MHLYRWHTNRHTNTFYTPRGLPPHGYPSTRLRDRIQNVQRYWHLPLHTKIRIPGDTNLHISHSRSLPFFYKNSQNYDTHTPARASAPHIVSWVGNPHGQNILPGLVPLSAEVGSISPLSNHAATHTWPHKLIPTHNATHSHGPGRTTSLLHTEHISAQLTGSL